MKRTIFADEHEDFRNLVRRFVAGEVADEFPKWEALGAPPREFFRRVAELGISTTAIPERFGGGGQGSYLFNVVVAEEFVRAHANVGSLRVHMDVVLPYLLHLANEEQQERWLPGVAAGDLVLAIAMTEPGTGSDLAAITTTARRDGDDWIINGAKTFISGGANADLVLVVARTSPSGDNRRAGLSLLVVPTATLGFVVGRKMEKIGLHAQDTVDLSFDDVRIPAANLLGEEGQAFLHLGHNLAQERVTIAVAAVSAAKAALDLALDYTAERTVFGRPIGEFQNSKFVLAECATDIAAGQALLDQALVVHDSGELDPADSAKVKLFCTEMQSRVVDKCLQLHGGYGYAREYPISRLYADARVTRIYGGTSEVMKSIIAKSLRS
ncbi:acyl-CoA dehydrogenase family protein [Rhodococcus sp. IEGM 1381]|uniref:acyl-CoA dehydrogenase family protein n=1 Tax=Rhodococcus sp. IEGM 1381 TaxID=3047085 RepID=UPI0024B6BC28|nr:acyl-CoA dehydrogenase family protein [Rhodococcus sp. IEGM 1381]MDI9894440.1 acyl-CoA dehydrogenase family protein [Rhodococcus sp. IEGM 1381]